MPSFSQRQGLAPAIKAIQKDSVDEELRSRLWSLLKLFVWDFWRGDYRFDSRAGEVEQLLDRLWFSYFKKPIDDRPEMFGNEYVINAPRCYDVLKSHFLKCPWNKVYDFTEFVVAHVSARHIQIAEFCESINRVLVEENSAYRIIGKQFCPITNDAEMAEVDAAASANQDAIREHIQDAMRFLSDRKNPNYRNSIKESISAVESLMKILTGTKSATLSEGLKRIESVVTLHPALRQAFEKLYAYTSDEQGVRHAIFDGSKVTHGDAKFVLVSCSAFINYVLEKFAERNQGLIVDDSLQRDS